MTFPERPSAPTKSAAAAAVDLDCLRDGLRILALRALRDPDAAEEAVQETLVRAVEALREGRLSDPAKLGAYVAGIARHVFAHARRDDKKTVPLEALPPEAGMVGHADPLDALISAAESERLQAAFASLSTSDQRLLRLCFYEQRTPTEVAATLGEPAERVRKRKSRALERLRQAFLGAASGHDSRAPGTEKEDAPGGAKERERQ